MSENSGLLWLIKPFRSHGFINRTDDMARVYVDLPTQEARRLQRELNAVSVKEEEKDTIAELAAEIARMNARIENLENAV
jgi:hypothetical protein